VGLTFLPEVLLLTGGPALAPPTADAQVLRLQVLFVVCVVVVVRVCDGWVGGCWTE
jgi:hypothetical protein